MWLADDAEDGYLTSDQTAAGPGKSEMGAHASSLPIRARAARLQA